MDKQKHRLSDEEISKMYKQADYRLPAYRRYCVTNPGPPKESPRDHECYWKFLLSDPLCQQQK